MIIRQQINELNLRPGDRVVGVAPWRDMLIVVTERGAVYQILREIHDEV